MLSGIITVGIIDDHILYRSALASLLMQSENYYVSLEAGNGKELQEKLKKNEIPQILLLDLQMPQMNGFETLGWLKISYPELPVIIVSMCNTEFTLLKLIQLGARAYLRKECEATELKMAIDCVLENGYYYNDPTSRRLLISLSREIQKRELPFFFTEEEWSFLQLSSTEMTYKEVAYEMNLSTACVDRLRGRLFAKMDVKSRVTLVKAAIRNGIVSSAV